MVNTNKLDVDTGVYYRLCILRVYTRSCYCHRYAGLNKTNKADITLGVAVPVEEPSSIRNSRIGPPGPLMLLSKSCNLYPSTVFFKLLCHI